MSPPTLLSTLAVPLGSLPSSSLPTLRRSTCDIMHDTLLVGRLLEVESVQNSQGNCRKKVPIHKQYFLVKQGYRVQSIMWHTTGFVVAGGGNRFLWEVPRHCYEDPEREGGGVWISASSQTTLTVPTFTSTISTGLYMYAYCMHIKQVLNILQPQNLWRKNNHKYSQFPL